MPSLFDEINAIIGITSLTTNFRLGLSWASATCSSAHVLKCRGSQCASETYYWWIEQLREKSMIHFADTFNRNVSGGKAQPVWHREHSGPGKERQCVTSPAPDFLDGGENANFVINEHVVVSRITPLHVFKLMLL